MMRNKGRVSGDHNSPGGRSAFIFAASFRGPRSGERGRRGTPAEVVLRLLILKRVRNWSYDALERERPQ
jgi:hypothetical protein